MSRTTPPICTIDTSGDTPTVTVGYEDKQFCIRLSENGPATVDVFEAGVCQRSYFVNDLELYLARAVMHVGG